MLYLKTYIFRNNKCHNPERMNVLSNFRATSIRLWYFYFYFQFILGTLIVFAFV